MFKNKFGRILAFGFLIFLVVYIVGHKNLLTPLLHVSLPIVIAVTAIKVAQIFINGMFTKLTLNAFGKEMSHKESAYLALLSSLGNYFGPLLGGFGVRAAYLKKKHDFALTHFVGTLYGYYIITFFTTALLGSLSLLAIYLDRHIYSPVVTLTYIGLLAVTALLFFVKFPRRPQFEQKRYVGILYKRIAQVSEGWEILVAKKSLFTKLLWLGFIMLIVGLLTSYLEFRALHLSIDLPVLVLYTTLASIALLVSFTPGAIGIRESIYIFSSSILLLNNNVILQLATIDRGIALLVLTLGYAYLQLWQRRGGLEEHNHHDTKTKNSAADA